jgi:site-specific DNA recombinase
VGKNTQKLVGYVRVSSRAGREDERFHSPDLQREAIERFAAARFGPGGFEFLDWFYDIDRSGTTQKRKVLDAAKKLAVEQQASIVVYDMSRWGRNIRSDLVELQDLEDQGVELLSVADGVDQSTAGGSFARHVLMAAAEMQADIRSEGWRSVIATTKRDGRWHGRIPFGYRAATDKEAAKLGGGAGLIVPDKRTAPVVRKAFSDYAGGVAMYEIGKRLVKQGHFKRTETATTMLRNPVYVGLVRLPLSRTVRRGVQEDVLGEVLTDANGRKRYRYDEVELVEGKHKALIDQATWDKVRARDAKETADRSSRRASGQPVRKAGIPTWWGAAVVRCGGCGGALTRNSKRTYTYLECRSRPTKPCPRVGSVRMDQLEPIVLEELGSLTAALVGDPREVAKRKARAGDEAKKRAKAEKEVAKAQERLAIGAADAIRQGLPAEVRDRIAEELSKDVAAAEARLADIGGGVSAADIEQVASRFASVVELWPKMTDPERRRLLRLLGVSVTIAPRSNEKAEPLASRVTIEVPW